MERGAYPMAAKTNTVSGDEKLALTSGAKVKVKRYGRNGRFVQPQLPPPPVLTISKRASLALTLEKYGIAPNERTARKLGLNDE